MDDRNVTNYTRTQLTSAEPVRRSWRRFAILIFLISAAAAGYWISAQRTSASAPALGRRAGFAQAMPVVAVPAAKGDIDITLNALGTVTSLATVTTKSQISGQLVRVAFNEGQLVEKGDLLAEIDSRPYDIALQQAQGALERDQALLQSAELDRQRYELLASTNAIARQQLDQQLGLVGQYKGNLISDQAQVDNAKLNIAYCHIVAPVTGRVGLRLVDPGNYVTPGDVMVVVAQLQPISVIFSVAEDNLPAIKNRLKAAGTLPVTAFDRSGQIQLAAGNLRTHDNQIDTTTGTVKLRADFSNEEDNLFPNQFVNVTLQIDQAREAVVIPTAAVQRGAPGAFVYLIEADNAVTVRPVTLGPASGGRVVVMSGLSVGDRVVIDGADKLRNGSKVVLRAPANEAPSTTPAPRSVEPEWYGPARGGPPDRRPSVGSRHGHRAL
jgi:multidrug efflux system membrane fusion protein